MTSAEYVARALGSGVTPTVLRALTAVALTVALYLPPSVKANPLGELAAGIAAGEWRLIPGSEMSAILLPDDAVPEGALGREGPRAILHSSNGATFDGRRLYFYGSGGDSYGGNEVYAFDLDRLAWERLTDPTALTDPAGRKACPGPVDDAAPAPGAVGAALTWSPRSRSFFVWQGATYCYRGWGGGRRAVWAFDPAAKTWRRVAKHPGRRHAASALDPMSGNVFVVSHNHAWEFDAVSHEYIRRSERARPLTDGFAAVDPERRLLVVIDPSGVRALSLEGETLGAFETVVPMLPDRDMITWGIAYDSRRKVFVLWNGATEVHVLDPATWRIDRWHRADVGPRRPRERGVRARWFHVPEEGVFVAINNVDQGVWLFRMPDRSGDGTADSGDVATVDSSSEGAGRVLRVCPPGQSEVGCRFDHLQRAVNAALPGDTIVLASGVYRQAASINVDRLTIRGEPGAHLMGATTEGKGALVIHARDVVIEGIECSHIAVPHRNGSCIKLEGVGLTVRDVYFHDSEQGILGGFGGTVLVEHSRFERNGRDGLAHGSIYAGWRLEKLVFRNNVVLDPRGQAHGVKSRARYTIIEGNVIAGRFGVDSRAIDVPIGGDIVIRNNVLEKGPLSSNPGMVGIALETKNGLHPVINVTIEGNTIIFDGPVDKWGVIVQQGAGGRIVLRHNRTIGAATNRALYEGENQAFRDRREAGLDPFPALPEPQ